MSLASARPRSWTRSSASSRKHAGFGGACDGLFTPRPLGPLFDIAAQLDGEDGELAVLCRQGTARDRLFAALLAELDTNAPVTIVVIEDVHWADEATIDLQGTAAQFARVVGGS